MIRTDRYPAGELLVFDHPGAGTQIPKGTVEPGEDVIAAARRELAEETGIADVRVIDVAGTWSNGPDGAHEEWTVVRLEPTGDVANRWVHWPVGTAEEERHVFRCHWLRLDATTADHLHPLFGATVDLLLG